MAGDEGDGGSVVDEVLDGDDALDASSASISDPFTDGRHRVCPSL